jgi:putative methyltransferase (TIGR04325 family)
VHLDAVLQYIEDYRELLAQLCALRPEYVILIKITAGAYPTYATAQRNLPGSVVPCWFFNADEIVSAMASNGYALMCATALEREYDQSNFEVSRRMGRMRNLLFARAK